MIVQGRCLTWEDGTPFFYLGDTAWQMLHRLSREEIDSFLRLRAQQGFTVIQTVLLAEFGGLSIPNYYGCLPLLRKGELPNPTQPDETAPYSYWSHVDYAVQCAQKYGLFLGLLPTWGDKFFRQNGEGPEIFTEENAEIYGNWLARRYGHAYNILWILGGDRPLEAKHRRIIDAMARGIRASDPNHLITFHPMGCADSTDALPDADYVDFHMAQTGHGVEQCYQTYDVMQKMARASEKPYLDAEPRYEAHPACFRPDLGYMWDAADVRQNAYWNVLSGACGHTYGHHCVWRMNREPCEYFPYTWQEGVNHPGAWQMRHVKNLWLSRDPLSLHPNPALLSGNYAGMGHMVAAQGNGYAYIYLPLGLPVTVQLSQMQPASCLRASWFDPRTGETSCFAILPAVGEMTLAPPSQGKGCDWVLVLEDGTNRT